MKQLTNIKSIRLSDIQMESLKKLEEYGVDISKFIRIAIKEKIKRDWKCIKEKKEKIILPF